MTLRFLGDMGLSGSTLRALRDLGFDAVHLRDEGFHRLSDREILAKAARESRVVLTFDLDFGDLLATGANAYPSVVIFRMADQRPATVLSRLDDVLQLASGDLANGAIVIVEDTRLRTRRLPIQDMGEDSQP